jgi:non-ribosomal peptide synthetase component F
VSRRFEYWRGRLEELPPVSLPLDHPRPSEPRFRGGVVPLEVPREVVDHLRQVGLKVGATLFQALATTWALLLSRYSGQRDVVFATAVDLRQRPEFERLVGCSLTPLALRVEMSDDPSFAELVVRVRNELLDGLERLVPFERLVRELAIRGPANANPVYQTMIVLEPAAVARESQWSIHQMEGEIGNAMGSTKVDLELELDERPEGHISGRLIFDGELFDRETAAALVANWATLAGAAASDPSRRVSAIQFVESSQERRQLIEWNATETERRAAGLADIFQASLAAHADMPAVGPSTNSVTYRDLDRRAHGVAARLQTAGFGPENVVAICGEPSAEMLVAMLGVVYAGATYVLVDPTLTADDIRFVLNDAGASAVLADPRVAHLGGNGTVRLPIADPGDGASAPAAYSTDAEICCLHYERTSGGELRGVKLRQASVVNLAMTLVEALGVGSADTVLLLRSTLFAAPALDTWLAMAAGARLVIAAPDANGSGAGVNEHLSAEHVSFIHATPNEWRSLIDTGLRSTRGVKALIEANSLELPLAEHMRQRFRILWCGWSSPETSGYATLTRITPERQLALGRPIANARAYVLDVHRKPLPVGVAGDLWISGTPVAAGYVTRSAGTDPTFADDPFGAGQAVRTGARARWRSGGLLELLAPHTLSQPAAVGAPGA